MVHLNDCNSRYPPPRKITTPHSGESRPIDVPKKPNRTEIPLPHHIAPLPKQVRPQGLTCILEMGGSFTLQLSGYIESPS